MCIEQKERYVGERGNWLIVVYGLKRSERQMHASRPDPSLQGHVLLGSAWLLSALPLHGA